jgi:hypothetical protein
VVSGPQVRRAVAQPADAPPAGRTASQRRVLFCAFRYHISRTRDTAARGAACHARASPACSRAHAVVSPCPRVPSRCVASRCIALRHVAPPVSLCHVRSRASPTRSSARTPRRRAPACAPSPTSRSCARSCSRPTASTTGFAPGRFHG